MPPNPPLPAAPSSRRRGRHPLPPECREGEGLPFGAAPQRGGGGAVIIHPLATSRATALLPPHPPSAAHHGAVASRHARAPRTPDPGCVAAAAAAPHVSGGVAAARASGRRMTSLCVVSPGQDTTRTCVAAVPERRANTAAAPAVGLTAAHAAALSASRLTRRAVVGGLPFTQDYRKLKTLRSELCIISLSGRFF